MSITTSILGYTLVFLALTLIRVSERVYKRLLGWIWERKSSMIWFLGFSGTALMPGRYLDVYAKSSNSLNLGDEEILCSLINDLG